MQTWKKVLVPWKITYPSTTWRVADRKPVYFPTIVFSFKCWCIEDYCSLAFLKVQKLATSSLPRAQYSHQRLIASRATLYPISFCNAVLKIQKMFKTIAAMHISVSLLPPFSGRVLCVRELSRHSAYCSLPPSLPLIHLRHKPCLGEEQGLGYASLLLVPAPSQSCPVAPLWYWKVS